MKIEKPDGRTLAETIKALTGADINFTNPEDIQRKSVGRSSWDSKDIDSMVQAFAVAMYIGKKIGYITRDKTTDIWEGRSKETRLLTATSIYSPELYTIKSISKSDIMDNNAMPIFDIVMTDSKGGKRNETVSVRDVVTLSQMDSDEAVKSAIEPLMGNKNLFKKIYCDLDVLERTIDTLNTAERFKLETAMKDILTDWAMLQNASELSRLNIED